MPTILNCLDEEQVTVMGGSHFTFRPGQMKFFSDPHIARSIARLREENGLVELPDEFDSISLLKPELVEKVITAEQLEVVAEAKKRGIDAYCRKLRAMIYNATISLQRDLDRANFKYDARVEATEADIKNLEKLNKYQKSKLDGEQKRLDKFKELEKAVGNVSRG